MHSTWDGSLAAAVFLLGAAINASRLEPFRTRLLKALARNHYWPLYSRPGRRNMVWY
jgi:hypothetical protein